MKINGKETSIEKPVALDLLMEERGFDIKKIAVMKNGNIVPRQNTAIR